MFKTMKTTLLSLAITSLAAGTAVAQDSGNDSVDILAGFDASRVPLSITLNNGTVFDLGRLAIPLEAGTSCEARGGGITDESGGFTFVTTDFVGPPECVLPNLTGSNITITCTPGEVVPHVTLPFGNISTKPGVTITLRNAAEEERALNAGIGGNGLDRRICHTTGIDSYNSVDVLYEISSDAEPTTGSEMIGTGVVSVSY